MNIQAIKFNLHKCTPKANMNGSGLCMLPGKSRFTFYGIAWCLTQDNKVSRTHHHGSDRGMTTGQTKMKRDTDADTHTNWVKATHKGNVFNFL